MGGEGCFGMLRNPETPPLGGCFGIVLQPQNTPLPPCPPFPPSGEYGDMITSIPPYSPDGGRGVFRDCNTIPKHPSPPSIPPYFPEGGKGGHGGRGVFWDCNTIPKHPPKGGCFGIVLHSKIPLSPHLNFISYVYDIYVELGM